MNWIIEIAHKIYFCTLKNKNDIIVLSIINKRSIQFMTNRKLLNLYLNNISYYKITNKILLNLLYL